LTGAYSAFAIYSVVVAIFNVLSDSRISCNILSHDSDSIDYMNSNSNTRTAPVSKLSGVQLLTKSSTPLSYCLTSPSAQTILRLCSMPIKYTQSRSISIFPLQFSTRRYPPPISSSSHILSSRNSTSVDAQSDTNICFSHGQTGRTWRFLLSSSVRTVYSSNLI